MLASELKLPSIDTTIVGIHIVTDVRAHVLLPPLIITMTRSLVSGTLDVVDQVVANSAEDYFRAFVPVHRTILNPAMEYRGRIIADTAEIVAFVGIVPVGSECSTINNNAILSEYIETVRLHLERVVFGSVLVGKYIAGGI